MKMEFIKERDAANEQPLIDHQVGAVESADASGINTTSVIQHVSTPYNFALAPNGLEFKIDSFVNRWVKIGNGTFSDADTPLSVVGSNSPIQDLLSDYPLADKTRHFRYYRGTIEVMLVLSVPGNCSGLYAMSAYPVLTSERIVNPKFTAHQALNGDHWALMTMESSTDVVMSLPFYCDKDMQSLDKSEITSDYVVRLFCFSPVKSAIAGGPSIASWTMYARFAEDTTFHLPFYQGTQYQGKKVHKLVSAAQKARKEKTLSKTAGTIKDVAQKLSVVPVLGGVASTVATGAKIAEDIFGWLGFSRENTQQSVQHFATRSVTNIVPVTGTDSCDVAGYDVANAISIDPEITGNVSEDQAAFASLAARWTLVDQFDFSVTSTQGQTLTRFPVTPGYCMGDASTNTHFMTTAGYIGIPFSYWRGDAEYLVVVPSAAVHRGTLQVFYAPEDGNLTTDPTNITLNSIFDISECSMAIYKVGYPKNLPMMPLEYWTVASPIQPLGLATGTIAVRVVNPLQSPNPTDSIKCSVFVRYKNIQFAVPRYNLRLAGPEGAFYQRWPVAIGYQGGLDEDKIQEVELVPSNGVYAVKDIVSGEEIMSARAMMQKPIRVRLTVSDTADHEVMPVHFGYTRSHSDRRIRTAAFHYGRLFVGVAASQVIKLVNCSDDNTAATCMIVPHWQISSHHVTAEDDVPDTGPFTLIGPNKGVEFRVPWYSANRFKTVNGKGGVDVWSSVASEDNVIYVKTYSHQMIAFYSFGDDIRLGPFCVTPPLKFPKTFEELPEDDSYPWLFGN